MLCHGVMVSYSDAHGIRVEPAGTKKACCVHAWSVNTYAERAPHGGS